MEMNELGFTYRIDYMVQPYHTTYKSLVELAGIEFTVGDMIDIYNGATIVKESKCGDLYYLRGDYE